MYHLLRTLALALALLLPPALRAQQLVDFEDFALAADTFRNGAALDTSVFDAGAILLPNTHGVSGGFAFWRGWSISTRVDTATPGFRNQYSAFPGRGAGGSATYAVGTGQGAAIRLAEPGATVTSLRLANTTYAALSMRDGDPFAKRFGGAAGDDADFFSVSFRGWSGGARTADSVTVFLADFRGPAAEDVILGEWREVDLSGLGPVDSLTLSFASSDVGEFGINTPLYVAIDDVAVGATSAVGGVAPAPAPAVWPNPARATLRVDVDGDVAFAVADVRGRVVAEGRTRGEVPVGALAPGVYVVRVRAEGGWSRPGRFVRGAR